MKILSFIEDPEIIKKILKHLDLWDFNPPEVWRVRSKPLPRANAPPNNIEPHLDYSDSQLPPPARHRSRSGEFPNSPEIPGRGGTRKRAGPTISFMWMSTIQKGLLPNLLKMEVGFRWIAVA